MADDTYDEPGNKQSGEQPVRSEGMEKNHGHVLENQYNKLNTGPLNEVRKSESEQPGGGGSGFAFRPDGDDNKGGGALGAAGAASREQEALMRAATNSLSPGRSDSAKDKLTRFFFGSRKRKQKTAAGGITVVAVGGVIAGSSLLSGPLQFIHIAQMLQQFHFSNQQNQSDDRVSKLIRYAYYAPDGDAYRTNLNYIGNKLADRFEKKLRSQGLQSAYTKHFGLKDGYVIDRDNERFRDMSDAEIKRKLQGDFGSDNLTFTTIEDENGNSRLFLQQPSGYRVSRTITRVTLQEAGYGKIFSGMGARVMGARDGVSWHPLRKLDKKAFRTLDKKIAEWNKQKAQNISEGTPTSNPNARPEPQNNPDATEAENQATAGEADSAAAEGEAVAQEGNTVNEEARSGADADGGKLSEFSNKINSRLGGGPLAAAGVLCMARGVAEKADVIKQEQTAMPLIRTGMWAISRGNQVMSGQDLTLEQLGNESKQLYDEKSGQSWTSAESIQAEQGKPGKGVPPEGTLQTLSSGTPLDFLVSGTPLADALDPICSTAGVIVQGVIGFLGGPVSALGGLVVGQVVGEPVSDAIAQYLSGQAVSLSPKGAQYGNYINFGAFMAANDQGISNGGRALTSQETAQLADAVNAEYQQRFQRRSLAHRLFSPTDRMSLASNLIDRQSGSVTADATKVTFATINVGRSLATTFGNLFSGVSQAASQPYNYGGMSEIAFSEGEMDNPKTVNPYISGDDAAAVLDRNGQDGVPDYIDRVKKCHGNTIEQIDVPGPGGGSNKVWDVKFGTEPVNIYSPEYKDIKPSCDDTSDLDWLRIRFLENDTMNMKAANCWEGDEPSCQEMGFGSTGAATPSSPTTPAGATIDMSTLYDSSVDVACADGTKDLGIQDGYTEGQKVKIRTCAVSNMPSTASEASNGLTVVNSRVSGVVYAMAAAAKSDGVNPVTSSGFRSMQLQECLDAGGCGSNGTAAPPGYSNHQMGLAIDVGDSAFNSWLRKNGEDFGYKWYGPGDDVHFSPTGG